MAKYRQVHITFWQDPFIEELEPMHKYFYLYLMTNSKTTQCGCYEISDKLIKYETGLTQKQIDEFIEIFYDNKKIVYNKETNEFLIINWLKHNSFKSPKVKSCILKEVSNIKDKNFANFINSILQEEIGIDSLWIDYTKSIDSCSKIVEPLYIPNRNKNNNNNKEQEQEKEKEEEQKKISINQEVFNHYISKENLVKHKKLVEPMKKGIALAIKTYDLDLEYLKKIIDRHSEKIEQTKNSEYPVSQRTLQELFGQKKYKSQDLICADYLDEKYVYNKKLTVEEIKQQSDKESAEKYGF